MIFLFSILFWFSLATPIVSQDNKKTQTENDPSGMLKQFNLTPENPNEKYQKERDALNNQAQKKILKKTFDSLSDREVDDYLKYMGMSTNGSTYTKRLRLRRALDLDNKEIKEQNPFDDPKKKKGSKVVIESASEAEYLSVDKTKSGTVILKGDVKVKLGDGILRADSVMIDSKRKELYAEGGVDFNDGDLDIKGEKLIYDMDLQRGAIYNTKASKYPSRFIGKKIKKIDEKKYVLDMGYFTTCAAEVPHYSLRAKKIIVQEGNNILATNVWLNIGGTNLFWVPLYYATNLGSGWVVQAGRSNYQGLFVQGHYQWSDPMSALSLLMPIGRQIKIDYYEKTGQAVQFSFWKMSPWLNYNLDLGFANYKQYQANLGYGTKLQNKLFESPVTNQVDRGNLCLKADGRVDSNAKCIMPAADFIQQNYPSLYPYLPNGRVVDYGSINQPWHKVDFLANAKSRNVEKDGTRNIQMKFEKYSTPTFDYEFGYKYQFNNTLRSFYTRRARRLPLIKQTQDWRFDYTETRGDLTVNLFAERRLLYNILKSSSGSTRSDFFPIIDTLPRATIKNSTEITRLPYFESPLYWDMNLIYSVTRYYTSPRASQLKIPAPQYPTDLSDPWATYSPNLLRTQYLTNGETGFRTNMNFGNYVAFQPLLYYGALKQSQDLPSTGSTISPSDLSRDRDLKRNSYEYVKSYDKLSFGTPLLLFTADYRRMYAIKRELPEKTIYKGRDAQHEIEFAITSNHFEEFEFSLRNIRDLRQFANDYNPQPTGAERWYFTIFRISGFYDFYDGFVKKRETLLERKRSFYSGIFMNNDLVYHTPKKTFLYNNLTLAYKMGGFSLPFVKIFKAFELGGSWYHVYRAAFLDNYRIYLQTDFQLTRNHGFEIDLDSRVTQPWRYTNQVGNAQLFQSNGTLDPLAASNAYLLGNDPVYQRTSFIDDIVNGTGLGGTSEKQKTALNINRLLLVYKMNLHNFEYRFGYAMELRSIQGGLSFDNQITFYNQSLFFTISLININLGDENSFSRLGRTRLYRFRKKPLTATTSTSSISVEDKK
ncbi:MAG: LPS-assembly protein LptD [Leptospiraceae bacterium]|nr:LPS-assembly protein LptD [Leptospiraceae bacterium]MCP5497606.1 LPS-assembly protein LptD [Leptospiraceae bacterium]